MATYTDTLVVYDASTGFAKKTNSTDTIVITTLKVGTGASGGLTVDTSGGGSTLSVTRAGLTRANDTITLNTGTAAVVATNTVEVETAADKLVIAKTGLTRSGGPITINAGSDDVVVTGNMRVGGNLDVAGIFTARVTTQVSLGDGFIELLASNTSASELMGGLTVNLSKASGATEFVISSYTSSTIVCSGSPSSPSFASGDIVLVANEASTLGNNGLYIVQSVATNTITIKTLLTAYTPFVQNFLTAGTAAASARVFKVNLAVLAVSNGSLTGTLGTIATGTWAYRYAANATESNFSSGWQDLTPSSLQRAYNLGNSITLTNSNDFTVNAPTLPDTAAISLNANKDSQFSVSGANNDLTLETTGTGGKVLLRSTGTSGDVNITAIDAIDIISSTGPITIQSGSGNNINLNSGTGNIVFTGNEIYGQSYGAGYSITYEAGVVAGDLVYITSSGTVDIADSGGSLNQVEVSGVALGSGKVHTVRGRVVPVKLSGSVSPSDTGNYIYLNASGAGTVVKPVTGATRQVGRLMSSTAVSGSLYPVLFNPAEGITLNVDPAI
jgi:hypothetical protein